MLWTVISTQHNSALPRVCEELFNRICKTLIQGIQPKSVVDGNVILHYPAGITGISVINKLHMNGKHLTAYFQIVWYHMVIAEPDSAIDQSGKIGVNH